jgi:hypothetical protein
MITSCAGSAFSNIIARQIGGIEVTERRGRRCEEFPEDLKKTRGYWKLEEEALYRTVWRIRFGRGHGPVVRQTA